MTAPPRFDGSYDINDDDKAPLMRFLIEKRPDPLAPYVWHEPHRRWLRRLWDALCRRGHRKERETRT